MWEAPALSARNRQRSRGRPRWTAAAPAGAYHPHPPTPLSAHSCSAPSLTIVGNVTVDIVDGKRALGGAVSYAAAVASAFGQRACVVTAHAPDADLGALFQASGAWPGQVTGSAASSQAV